MSEATVAVPSKPFFHVDELEWRDYTGYPISGAAYKRIADTDYTSGSYSVEVVRLAPNHGSTRHLDPMAHMFYVLSGEGKVEIAGEEAPVRAGSVCHIPARVPHLSWNTGTEDLVILVIYHPARPERAPTRV